MASALLLDMFVNDAWAKDMGIVIPDSAKDDKIDPSITVLADGDGDLVKELGLVEDMGFGVGVRSKRFAMILQDGVVSRLEVDEGLDSCDKTSAENVVRLLGGSTVDESEMDPAALAGVAVVLAGAAAYFAMNGGGGLPGM